MKEAVIALGSNVGDCLANLKCACDMLKQQGCEILKKSSLYKTEPWGYKDQEDFLNGAILIATDLEPLALLEVTQGIEKEMGRQKLFLNGPRNIDLDILLYGDEIVNMPNLIIPHPRIMQRLFVLQPMLDIVPDYVIPGFDTVVSAFKSYDGDERIELTEMEL